MKHLLLPKADSSRVGEYQFVRKQLDFHRHSFPSVNCRIFLTARHLPKGEKKDRLRQQFWQKAVICIPSFIQFSTHPASPYKTLPYSEYWPICASDFPKKPASPVKRYPSEKHPEAAHNSVMFNLISPYISDNLAHINGLVHFSGQFLLIAA